MTRKNLFLAAAILFFAAIGYYFYNKFTDVGLHSQYFPAVELVAIQKNVNSESHKDKVAATTRLIAIDEASAKSYSLMAVAYKNSQKDRSFALSSWKLPHRGGQFYAAYIVDKCASLRKGSSILNLAQPDITVVGESNFLQAMEALRDLQNKCGQFSDEEFSKYSTQALLAEGNPENDVLMRAVQDYSKATNISERENKLKALMKLNDPLAFEDLGVRISLYRDDGGSYLYFDNEKQYINRTSLLSAAFYLLPCGLGLVCDSTDPELELKCVSGAGCYDSRMSRVKSEMAGSGGEDMHEILRLYDAILQSINNGDAYKFIPPP